MSESTTLSSPTSSPFTPAPPKRRVILCGNPGVGKSTILNTLTNSQEFPSGVSLGSGLTQHSKIVTVNQVEYADTPGLADLTHGHQAAEQVSHTLSNARCFTLVFVVTLQSGSVRPADLQTIRSVCNSLQHAGIPMRTRVNVIVNRVEDVLLTEETRQQIACVLGQAWGHANVLMVREDAQADAGTNEHLSDVQDIRAFIDGLPTVVRKDGGRISVVYKNPVDEARRARDLQQSVVAMRSAVARAQRVRARSAVVFVVVGVGVVVSVFKLFRLFAKEQYA